MIHKDVQTSYRLAHLKLQLSGAAGDLSASGTQFSSLKVFAAPCDNKSQEEKCLFVSEEFLYAPVLTAFPNKRKDVIEEPIIVIYHLKVVLKDIKGKKQRPVCSSWSNTPWHCLQSVKGFFSVSFFCLPTRSLVFWAAGCVLREPRLLYSSLGIPPLKR